MTANAFGMPSSGWLAAVGMNAAPGDPRPTYAVRLIDRRTGAAHRINGRPLVVFSRNPDAAVVELLDGRDPDVWEARAERLRPETAR